MNPTDWLRRKAAAAVRIGPGPLGEPTQTDVERVAPLVEQALRERVAAVSIAPPDTGPRTASGEPLHCPCGVIYSHCYYPATHTPARPGTPSS